jgi:hypothetical protein
MNKLFSIIISLTLMLSPVSFAGGSGGGYANQILGISNGIIGATVITRCPMSSMQPSLMMFMAGGVAYIAKEVMGGKSQDKSQGDKMKSLENLKETMVEGGDYQKAVLRAALSDEEKTLSLIKQRKSWMSAIMAIYTAAAVMAFMEFIWSLPYPVGISKPDSGGCSSNPAATKGIAGLVAAAYSVGSSMGGGSSFGGAVASTAAVAAASAAGQFLFNINAGAMIADATSTALDSALGRVAWFGASAAVAGMVIGDLGKSQQKVEGNISKLRRVLAQFERQTKTSEELIQGESKKEDENKQEIPKHELASSSGNKELKELPTFERKELKKHCLNQTGEMADYSPEACNSGSTKIASAKMDVKTYNPTLIEASNSANSFAQAISDGDMGKANVEAEHLSSMALRLKESKDAIQKEINDKLKAAGLDTVDMDKLAQDQLKKMTDDLYQGLADKGVKTASLPKSFSSSDYEAILDSQAKGEADAAAEAAKSKVNEVSNENVINLSNGKPSQAAATPLFTEGVGGETFVEPAENSHAAIIGMLESGLKKYEKNESDISVVKESSLFDQISNRYKLSYPKIMERRKPVNEVSPESAKN